MKSVRYAIVAATGLLAATMYVSVSASDEDKRGPNGNSGKHLFERETFGGNGRTCSTCHSDETGTVSAQDAQRRFAANPKDPLFLHDGSDDFQGNGVSRMLTDATVLVEIPLPPNVSLADDPSARSVVLRRGIPPQGRVDADDLGQWLAGVTIVNDLSARDVQLPQGQFYKGKSYRGFGPVGPGLVLLEPDEWKRWPQLRMCLAVNGQVRQDNTTADMIVRPAQALTALSRFQPMAPGDLLLTGTPGGTALKAPPKAAEKLAALLPPATKWKLFFARQARNPRYLRDGDVITASIASHDGRLDLGTQHNTVIGKKP